jgi:hypothetical protein
MANSLQNYFDAMDDLWLRLPSCERIAKLEWESSADFTRDSDWPGWVKYLGPRPVPNSQPGLRRVG